MCPAPHILMLMIRYNESWLYSLPQSVVITHLVVINLLCCVLSVLIWAWNRETHISVLPKVHFLYKHKQALLSEFKQYNKTI